MTNEQYERWKDFAIRMAGLFPADPKDGPSAKWIRGEVESFLEWYTKDDFERIVSWDSGPVYVCDRMSEWETESVTYQLRNLVDDETYRWLEIHRGIFCDDGRYNYGELFNGHDTPLEDEMNEIWSSPVHCCIRAGLDLASEPSAGVLGFTVCDLRQMYPEGIPDWINSQYQDKDGNPVDLNSGACNVGIWL